MKIYLLLFLLTTVILCAIYCIYKLTDTYLNKKIYTRERFAFFATTSMSSLVLLLIAYSQKSTVLLFFNVIIDVINKFWNWNIPKIDSNINNPELTDLGFWMCILLGYFHFLFKYFKNWDGKKSIKQFEYELYLEGVNLSSLDKILAIVSAANSYHWGKKAIETIEEKKSNVKYQINFETPENENKQWFEEVAELFPIISNQYKIDIETDWHREESCLISNYGNSDKVVGILCKNEMPTKKTIEHFINFTLQNIKSKTVHKLIIAVKEDFQINTLNFRQEVLFFSEKDLLSELIDFSSYRKNIIDKFENDNIIEGYEMKLNDIYVTPTATIIERPAILENEDIVENIFDKKSQEKYSVLDIENYISEWLDSNIDKKQLAILGEYGQGKSVLAQRVCYLIFKGIIKTDRIPILITLGGKYPKQFETIDEFFAHWATYRLNMPPIALKKLHYAGKLLIIFDGFDETELVGEYSMRVEHFRRLWKFNTEKSKMIITGRPNYFLNNKELASLLRTGEQFKESIAYCEEIHLNRFNSKQIKLALRKSETSTLGEITDLLNSVGAKSSFYDLMSRPSHLFFASLIWKEKLSVYKSNINSARVYECFLNDAYNRQAKKGFTPPLSDSERAYFIQAIALKSIKTSGLVNIFESGFVTEIVKDLLSSGIPIDTSQKDEVILSDLHQIPLKERFSTNIEETYSNDIRSCGVLVRDLSTFNSFRFAHKSFMEYLASDFYQFECLKEKGVKLRIHNSIKNSLSITKDIIPLNPEIFKFSLEILILRVFDKKNISENSKERALTLYKSLYPYSSFIPLWLAMLLRPFTRMKKRVRVSFIIIILMSLTFPFLAFILTEHNKKPEIHSMYFLFFMLFSTMYMLRASFGMMINLFKNLLSRRKSISDADNLLLWYSCCKQIGISNWDLQILVGIQTRAKLEMEYLEIGVSPKIDEHKSKSSLVYLKNMIRNDFNSVLKFFLIKK